MQSMHRLAFVLCALTACGDAGGFPDAAVPDAAPTATFSVNWSVVDQNNEPLPCDRIAGQAMTVLAHNKAFDGGTAEAFGCNTGMGRSQAVVAGLFDFNFELTGTFGLLARGASQTSVEVPAGTNTELAPVVFQVEALGGVNLQLASGQTGGNCGAVSANGAGIDAMTITLTHNSDASCEPITLAISQGATQPAGTYTIDCAAPVEVGCIEADQMLTATNVPSDGYTIRVRGQVATKNCWVNNDTIQVPPLQKTLTRTLNLAKDTNVPGCM